MAQPVEIAPVLVRSSKLCIPVSHASSELIYSCSTTQTQPLDCMSKTLNITPTCPPPPEPIAWMWQCHQCSRIYQLTTTNRCLEDGHRFCAGTTIIKRNRRNNHKKVLKHKACASEFDYAGWRVYGAWRREMNVQPDGADDVAMLDANDAAAPNDGLTDSTIDAHAKGQVRDCWMNCDFPSECRWGKQVGLDATGG